MVVEAVSGGPVAAAPRAGTGVLRLGSSRRSWLHQAGYRSSGTLKARGTQSRWARERAPTAISAVLDGFLAGLGVRFL